MNLKKDEEKIYTNKNEFKKFNLNHQKLKEIQTKEMMI